MAVTPTPFGLAVAVRSARSSWARATGVALFASVHAAGWMVGALVVFAGQLVLSGGFALGVPSAIGTGLVAVIAWRRGRGRGGRHAWSRGVGLTVATALVVGACIPMVPIERVLPADIASELGGTGTTWALPSGDRVAVYHYPPVTGARRGRVLCLAGGGVRGVPLIDHRFLAGLAGRGWDVWTYDQPGAGRSGLLPESDYTIEHQRLVLDAVLDRLGPGTTDVIGFSAGGSLLSRALAGPAGAARIRRAVLAEPGPMDGPTAALSGPGGRPTAAGLAPPPPGRRASVTPRYGTALALQMAGLLPLDNDFVGQGEMLNAFGNADLGDSTAGSYCAQDAHRIPGDDSDAPSFSFNPVASLRLQAGIRASASIRIDLGRSRTPAMLLLGECSSQVRIWQTSILAADPATDRVQYLPGVGHRLWNGLDDNNRRAIDIIDAYLTDRPPPVPNYPTRADIAEFLADGK